MEWYLDEEEKNPEKKYKRIERPIRSKFWQAVHNLVAHPMLAVYRPWGVWLHEYTAKKMYAPGGKEYAAQENEVNG